MKIKFPSLGLIIPICIIIFIFLFFYLTSPSGGLPLSRSQIKKLTVAGMNGDGEACFALYMFYVKDERKAYDWLEKSAHYGYPRAKTILSDYFIYLPDNESKKKGLSLLESAAAQNYTLAQESLGSWYRNYQNNFEKAVYWYDKASRNGSISAMLDLAGLISKKGQNYEKLLEGYKWAELVFMRAEKISYFGDKAHKQEANKLKEEILNKAIKMGLNVSELKKNGEREAMELNKITPYKLDLFREQNTLLKNIQDRFGKQDRGVRSQHSTKL